MSVIFAERASSTQHVYMILIDISKNLFYLYGDTIMAPSIKNKFSTYSVFHEFAFLIHVSKSRKKNCCTLQGDDTIQTIISVCT